MYLGAHAVCAVPLLPLVSQNTRRVEIFHLFSGRLDWLFQVFQGILVCKILQSVSDGVLDCLGRFKWCFIVFMTFGTQKLVTGNFATKKKGSPVPSAALQMLP